MNLLQRLFGKKKVEKRPTKEEIQLAFINNLAKRGGVIDENIRLNRKKREDNSSKKKREDKSFDIINDVILYDIITNDPDQSSYDNVVDDTPSKSFSGGFGGGGYSGGGSGMSWDGDDSSSNSRSWDGGDSSSDYGSDSGSWDD